MSALHPEDGFRDARFNRRGEPALAGRDAGEARGVEADMGEARDDHGGDLGGRRLPREVELGALLDAAREERGAVTAGYAPVEAPVAEGSGRGAEQAKGLLKLSEEVETTVLGHSNPGLVARPEAIVLPNLDIERGAGLELGPAADREVVAPPDVACLEQPELLAATAGERGGDSGETVEPVVEEGPADWAASPGALGVGRLDARARRVRRRGDGQETANRELVDGKLQDPWHRLKAAEGVDDAAVGARAVHGCRHAEAAVPALDRVDGVLEDRHGGLEHQAVPHILALLKTQ